MYIRSVKTKNKVLGTEYYTYKLVESQRVSGNEPKQINLLSLGKLEGLSEADIKLLAKRIEELYNHTECLFCTSCSDEIESLAQFFNKKLIQKQFIKRGNKEEDTEPEPQNKDYVEVDINSIKGIASSQIGGEYLCYQALQELGLNAYLKEGLCFTETEINHCMLALTGRLLYSMSENNTAKWLNDNSAAQEFYPLDSAKVNKNQLYSASNLLYQHKDKIEQYMNNSTEKIFNLKRKIVLYDLTNTHFEGQMEGSEKANFGRNKQKRTDCRQITLGLLTDENGFPINSRYYPGNISEPKTLDKVLKDLSNAQNSNNLFTNEKPCIIMDAGIASEDNLKMLLKEGYEYICVSRSEHNNLIKKVEESELVTFKNKSNKELSALMFKEAFDYEDIHGNPCQIQESRIYVKSPDKEQKERAMDNKKLTRFEDGLKQIQKTVNNPRGQRSIAHINQRIGRLKERNKGIVGSFEIDMKSDGKDIYSFTWELKPGSKKEKKQGVYFLRTSIKEQQEEKIWQLYRIINEVEDSFSTLKSELNMRPNFHHSDATIEAHINLCVLSYYIVSFIRYRLKSKQINQSWLEIRRIMSTQKCSENVSKIKSGKTLWTKYCTRPLVEANQIYHAMGYKNIPYYRKSIII